MVGVYIEDITRGMLLDCVSMCLQLPLLPPTSFGSGEVDS